jgi:hypothetical protein
MLGGRTIIFEPAEDNRQIGYRFRGEASVSEVLAGSVVASPTGTAKRYNARFWGTAA